MKLLFDLQGLQNQSRDRGIGRYVLNLFQAIAARSDVEVFGLLNGALTTHLEHARNIVAAAIGDANVLVFPGMSATMPHDEVQKRRRRLCEASYEAFVENAGCDALLVGTLFEGFNDETIVSLKFPGASRRTPVTATILYDLIPLLDQEKYLGFHLARDWYFDRVDQMVAADLLLAISESSRQEGILHLGTSPECCINVNSAIDPKIFYPDAPATRSELRDLNISKPFLMHTSAFDERKNFEGLIEAFALLPKPVRQQYQLVLVGGSNADAAARIRQHAIAQGLSERDVILPGYIPDPLLAKLYRSCSLFVFPSFHEGFGLPALEAMSCGCPTIGSNLTSVPEVIGNEDLLFDPRDPVEMASLIEAILTDPERRADAIRHADAHARTFSWEKVADHVITALKTACAAKISQKPETDKAPSFVGSERALSRIAANINLSEYPPNELLELANVLALSEERILESQGHRNIKEGTPWRIEGPFDSSYSLALLNRETARALTKLGYQVVLKSTEGPGDFDPSPAFLAENRDLQSMHERTQRSTHDDAFVVSRNLFPPRVEDMRGSINALHHFAWEETGLPQAWANNFNTHLNMMTCLSTHVEKIMIDNGVSVPMMASGCGVDHWERIGADPNYNIAAKGFKFLHVSSCFPRKGVESLIEAYGMAFSSDDNVTLIIKTFENPHNNLLDKLAEAKTRNPRFPDVITIFADLSDAQLKALYTQCDVMVGPSHAEGYGLPFAEAMLSGIPVITTAWGGQTDFCNEGNAWLVDYRFERANTHFGLWLSAWATPHSDALAKAMQTAHQSTHEQRQAMAATGRTQLLRSHKWSDVATRLSAAAKLLPARAVQPDPRIGWISTWNERCGVATYSDHLLAAMDANVVVFGPENYDPVKDDDRAERLWTRSKKQSNLVRILDSPLADDIEVFVVQFNNTFFNHQDLGNFIARARARDKRVILCLHSTRDQPETMPAQDFHLAHMVSTLAICDRLLVHSIADLNHLKAIGLTHNVALFPHGTLVREATQVARRANPAPLIATYGFALPHKGLPEVVEAIRLLKERNSPVRLRMVNAEYPATVSSDLVTTLKSQSRRHGLDELIEFHNRFLTDEESLALLAEADLVVFPYQTTAESASGAVRYGMALNRPVAVTPIAIFDDMEGAVHTFSGTSAKALADGIQLILQSIQQGDAYSRGIAVRADEWRRDHDYANVAKRLHNICRALR